MLDFGDHTYQNILEIQVKLIESLTALVRLVINIFRESTSYGTSKVHVLCGKHLLYAMRKNTRQRASYDPLRSMSHFLSMKISTSLNLKSTKDDVLNV